MTQHSRLCLRFERGAGRTVLAGSYCQGSWRVIRPFWVGETALVQIIHIGPGAMAGDHFELDVVLGAECKVILTHQSATKILSMADGQIATQDVYLTIGDRARLDYLPGLNIPFRGAAFRQKVHVELAQSCELGLMESWAMGRIARNEYMNFQLLDSSTSVHCAGSLLYRDRLFLSDGDCAAGLMENYRYYSSGYWFGPSLPSGTACPIQQNNPLVVLGPIRPGEAFFRCLAQDSTSLENAETFCLDAIWKSRGEQPVSLARFRS